MIGNIGVHFEDAGYAVTDISTTLNNLVKAGYKKVAATGLGTFTQYENVLDIVHHDDLDIDIIPAIQCHFEEPDQFITLIAKDYEGYLQLSKIITESNALGTVIEDANNNNNNKAIVYLDNLKRNVKDGHLILTTSGKNGLFKKFLTSERSVIRAERDALEKELSNIYTTASGDVLSYEEAHDLVDYYAFLDSIKKPTKAEYNMAKKHLEETGDRSDIDELDKREALYLQAKTEIPLLKPEMTDINKAVREHERDKEKYEDLIDELISFDDKGRRSEAVSLYNELKEIFGDNIYFELQSHNDELETASMNELVSLAYEVQGNDPKFVIGNDVRIGLMSNDENMEYELHRLSIAQFLNNKTRSGDNEYIPYSETEKISEYCIKTEEEMKKDIIGILKDRFSNAENIVENAAKMTDSVLESCFIEHHEQENHYPKFCDDENAEFEKKCREGIPWRFPDGMSKEYQDRLERELDVIKSMGYAGYHLIVQDYLQYARLLGYIRNEEMLEDAPLSIEELDKYLTDNNIERIGVGIGPGRGSAAGSLCCYLLGITDIDPIKNGLLFERFLNTERVSMPDIDSDFRPDVRYKAIEYVKNKYGENNICQIVTKMYNQAKGCIHDAARYVGAMHAYKVQDKNYAKQIRQEYEKMGNSLAKDYEAYEQDKVTKTKTNPNESDPSVLDFMKTNQTSLSADYKEILNNALYIDQLFTGYGRHAAGVIISKDEVGKSMPLMLNPNTKMLQTQCQMAHAEAKGYLKMDFLGLRNLSTITDATKYPFNESDKTDTVQDAVKRERDVLNDKAIFEEIFCKGLTQGVFQFESPGMKKMLIDFQPQSFDDIVLLIAAYRPGPMAYIPEMTARKKWEQSGRIGPEPERSISLNNEALDKILAPTYGCPVYQEQIMQIFQDMAGYSLGRADEVRRAMSKKKVEKLEKERVNFIHGNSKEIEDAKNKLEELKQRFATLSDGPEKESIKSDIDNFVIPKEIPGCVALHGIKPEEANELFDQMMPFAKYGFNKSHAAAYSVVSMQTAWLKLHRTKDFYCAALNNWRNRDEVTKYAAEMGMFGIRLLPPTLDSKIEDFIVEEDGIRFPIVKAKDFEKNFNVIPDTSLQGFIRKNPNISETKLKTLIYLGCFDRCWNFKGKTAELEKKRVNGSRSEQINWLSKYFKTLTSINNLDNSLKHDNLNEKDRTKKETQLQEKNNILLEAAKADIEAVRINDATGRMVDVAGINHAAAEVFEERKKEYDLTGTVFAVDKDMKKINQYRNKNSFNELLAGNPDRNAIEVPSIVLSISNEKRTKRNTLYFDVLLMDRNGTIFSRRMKDRPTETCGIYKLYPEAQKWFVCESKTVADISFEEVKKTPEAKETARQNAIKDFINKEKNYMQRVPMAQEIPIEETR